jgi:hypothetical protein
MNIYEVVFWGSRGNTDAEDTLYLVRAPNFKAAAELAERNGEPWKHNGNGSQMSDVVYEVGIDLSPYASANPCILRGPYIAMATNYGWKSWSRIFVGTDYTNEWEEQEINIKGTEGTNGTPTGQP